MNGDQSVRLQFPADAGTTEVVSVLSAGVAERYGLDPTDARELASAVCSAVILLIDSSLTDANPPEANLSDANRSDADQSDAVAPDATGPAGDRGSGADQAPSGQAVTSRSDGPTTATSAAGGMIQVTFSPDKTGLRATVARPGLWFRGVDEAERAWRRLTERIGDKVCARDNPGAEAAYRFVMNRVMRGG